jgi:hypothetical protein
MDRATLLRRRMTRAANLISLAHIKAMLSSTTASVPIEETACACTRCGSVLRRLGRKGFLQRFIFPVFGYYPWECFACRRKWLVRTRGQRRFRRLWDDFEPECEADAVPVPLQAQPLADSEGPSDPSPGAPPEE